MASENPFHHLLKQSLIAFQAESTEFASAQDRELSQALHKLTGRLSRILDSPSDPSLSDECMGKKPDSSPHVLIHPSVPTQSTCITSGDGVILMANIPMCEMLGIERTKIGKVSLSEFIPEEEWATLSPYLGASSDALQSVEMSLTIYPSQGLPQTVTGVASPMVDHSHQISTWHWLFTIKRTTLSTPAFVQLMPTLEAQLYGGRSVDECLRQICEGLVQIFPFAFVWIATVKEKHAKLRARALANTLDWEPHGNAWWMKHFKQEAFLKTLRATEEGFVSNSEPVGSAMAWCPPEFQVTETYAIPLAVHEPQCGILVVCSGHSLTFDDAMKGWLRLLSHQIERFMVRGQQLEQWRLQSAAMDSVNDAICVTDLQGRLEWVNEAYVSLIGCSPQDILGSSLKSFPHAQLQILRPHLGHTSDHLNKCVRTEVMQTGKNGQSLVLEQVVAPVMNQEGHLTHFVTTLHDITARKTQELLMKYQAYHDPLTDLPNRIMFDDRLQQAVAHARRNGKLLALFFLDLDNFKTINDLHGHASGDRVLRVVAKRLVTCVRATDTVARLCGDEFTIILQGLDHIQDIRQVAQKILECLAPPVRLGGNDIPIQISIGIAVYPKDSTDAHRLVEIADQSMYRAKEDGGRCWYFATAEWNKE